jgi:hypothetical protein
MNEFGPGRPGGPLAFTPKRKGRPTGRLALIRRLRRDHPDLHQQVLAGELTPHRAAIVAGFLRKPGEPKRLVPAIATITPLQEMDLWLGPSHHDPAFASEEERRRLWCEHRECLMGYWANDGHRPQAWWKYDSPIPFPGPARERSTLYEHGLIPGPASNSERFSTSSRRGDLNRSVMKVASSWMIANIAFDDALILPHRANPAGLNFRERRGWRNRPGALAAMYSSTSVLPDQFAEGRTESGPALRNLGNGT